MNVEQELAALIVERETEIFLVLDYLSVATNETTLLAASDEIL